MADIKSSAMDVYYRAYREYTESMKNVNSYNNLKTSLKNSAKNPDGFSGSIAHREIDLEWVQAVEFAVPYIDRAIREQRRFISQNEEIVPIAKSKKVTTESVRHLAQHTNLIGKVEDDKVTPKSILNIQREESFAIYENRFLRSLINRAITFVGRCYSQLKDTPESALANIQMERNSVVDSQLFNVNVECSIEYNEQVANVDIAEDVSNLTEYERVIRLRKILSDFLSAPLIMGIANTPEVRNPITRTNLLTKDQNFREALKLWEFFDHYDKPGFTLFSEEKLGTMQPEMQNGMYDVFTMMQFVVRLNLSKNLQNVLESNYINENQRREHLKELAEEERKKEVEKQIQVAIDNTKKEFDQLIDALHEQNQIDLENKDKEWEEKFAVEKNNHANELNELNKKHVNRIIDIEREKDKELDKLNEKFVASLAEKDVQMENTIAEYEKKQKEEIESLNREFNSKVETISKNLNGEINRLTEENNDLRDRFDTKIDIIKFENKRECEEAAQKTIDTFKNQYESELGKMKKNIEKLNNIVVKKEEENDNIKSKNRELSKQLFDTKAKNDVLQGKYSLLKVTYESNKKLIKKKSTLLNQPFEQSSEENENKED